MDGRSYSQRVVVVQPKGGLPWRRLLVGVGLVVVLFAQLPVPQVAADTFAGNSVSCTTQAHVVTSFPKAGWASAGVQFRLTIPSGGTVIGRWLSSDGWVGVADAWSAGTSGSGTWWAPGMEDDYMHVQFGGSGSMSYVLTKAASYGGCFSVDNVVVTRHPIISSTPVPPDPSAQPSQSAAPPSDPPGEYGCSGTTIDTCDPPPEGWCWVGRFVEAGDAQLAPCDDSPDTGPGGTGGTEGATAECTVTSTGMGFYSQTCFADGPTVTAGQSVGWTLTCDTSNSGAGPGASGGYWTKSSSLRGDGVNLEPSSGTWAPAQCSTNNPVSGSGSWGSGTHTMGGRLSVEWWDAPAGYSMTLSIVWTVDGQPWGDADGDGWSDSEEQACGSDPNDGNDGCPSEPSAPPSWPSPPPPQPGGLGGPVDQCEGPDDAGLFMCGDGTLTLPSLGPVEICGPGDAELAVCQPAPSFEAGGEEGDGSGEDGALGSQQGHGLAECEGANLTPVEAKVGYVAPEPVPTVTPLDARLAGFSVFSLDRAPAYVVGAIGWVGDMVGVIAPSVRNTATTVYNGAIHLVVPGDCIGTMVETEVEELMLEPPFSIWTTAREAVEAGAAGGAGLVVPGIPVPGGGSIEFPVDTIEAGTAPWRPYLSAAVWLIVALGVVRIVVGSFNVGKGSE